MKHSNETNGFSSDSSAVFLVGHFVGSSTTLRSLSYEAPLTRLGDLAAVLADGLLPTPDLAPPLSFRVIAGDLDLRAELSPESRL